MSVPVFVPSVFVRRRNLYILIMCTRNRDSSGMRLEVSTYNNILDIRDNVCVIRYLWHFPLRKRMVIPGFCFCRPYSFQTGAMRCTKHEMSSSVCCALFAEVLRERTDYCFCWYSINRHNDLLVIPLFFLSGPELRSCSGRLDLSQRWEKSTIALPVVLPDPSAVACGISSRREKPSPLRCIIGRASGPLFADADSGLTTLILVVGSAIL